MTEIAWILAPSLNPITRGGGGGLNQPGQCQIWSEPPRVIGLTNLSRGVVKACHQSDKRKFQGFLLLHILKIKRFMLLLFMDLNFGCENKIFVKNTTFSPVVDYHDQNGSKRPLNKKNSPFYMSIKAKFPNLGSKMWFAQDPSLTIADRGQGEGLRRF